MNIRGYLRCAEGTPPEHLHPLYASSIKRAPAKRVYFTDEPCNTEHFALRLVEPERRATLMQNQSRDVRGNSSFNVKMEGEDETVFFDC